MRVGILTGGGDCPALNAVIRAAVKTSVGFGWEVLGIEEGFDGLVHGKARPMTASSVSGILHLGGTILGTTNAANPFCYPTLGEGGKTCEQDISETSSRIFANWNSMP
jgi:6-phosphofructokinase